MSRGSERLAAGQPVGAAALSRAMTEARRTLDVTPGLDEHQLWLEFAKPLLAGAHPNVRDICEYGFTEMVNNVIDHSGSPELTLAIDAGQRIGIRVFDSGVGIFSKIRDSLGLDSEHSAALELAKGRVTTDPERHTGEGIFFTARMFDSFVLISGEIAFHFRAGQRDWWFEDRESRSTGTIVVMEIEQDSPRSTRQVFDQFASPEGGYQFDTTVINIRLFGEGGPLVSRSQAKRIISRVEDFRTVILDFEGVEEIGPAFADEIFRVFGRSHPEIQLLPINASSNVNQMIVRALNRNGEQGRPA